MKTISDCLITRPVSPVIEEIITFFDNNCEKSESEYVKTARGFIESLIEKIKADPKLEKLFAQDRKDFSFYNWDNYNLNIRSKDEVIEASLYLHHVEIQTAIGVFPEVRAREETGPVMIEQASPDISAYEWIPFVKLDIKHSTHAYEFD